VPWPEGATAFCWGAHVADGGGERLVGAIVAEPAERAVMLAGPVIAVDAEDALEVAAQLVTAAIDHAQALGVETVFARPQGLDRIWIRYGFLPVPESALPAALAGRERVGLYAWRGGTALWTFRERDPI
jgi:N-acetylglutamate synthase-like GNAT family acetyltransferase